MRRHLPTLALLTLFAVFARAEEKAAAPDAGKDKITVVKTWKELCARPELELGGGLKIRLGVEATRAPRLSGVMIYCLAEGYEKHWESKDSDTQLGPVQIRIERRDFAKEMINAVKEEQKLARESMQARCALFARAVPISDGIYDVTVLDQKGKPLAACVITGTAEAAPVWSPFVENRGEVQQLREQEGDAPPEVSLKYEGHTAAVPKLDGVTPLRWETQNGERKPAAFGDDDPLPNLSFPDAPKDAAPAAELAAKVRALVPKLGHDDFETREAAMRELVALGKPARAAIAAAASASSDTEVRSRARQLVDVEDSDFSVRMSGRNFLLSMKSEMEISMFPESVLARWWVNGKPFVPGPLEKLQDGSGHRGGLSFSARQILVKFEMDAAKLGAKSGDKIGVQFLYCPMGYEFIGEMKQAMWAMKSGNDTFPRISNKVEFTVP